MVNFAQKYRPASLEDILSQEHLVGKSGVFRAFIAKRYFPNAILFGSPGCGKTTLARVIAKELDFDFYEFNATTIKVDELRKVISRYKGALTKPLIFIDEIHRLTRTQEEVLLPFMESGEIVLIGASTANPYYSLSSAFRSRSHLFELKGVKSSDIVKLISKVAKKEAIEIEQEALDYIANSSNGDARGALNLLESASVVSKNITIELVKSIRPQALRDGSSQDDSHYNLTSAMIKSIRGSDIDAGLYYLARLISGGESAEFIARRLAILASEDIGNANPNATNLAVSVMNIVSKIGFPEARIPLAQLVVYLASSPKSRSSYEAINRALEAVNSGTILDIPENILPNSKSYKNPHNFGGFVKEKYLQKELNFYKSSKIGFEKNLTEWLNKIKNC